MLHHLPQQISTKYSQGSEMSSETSQINAQRQVSALTYINDKNIQAFKVENIKSFLPSPGQHSHFLNFVILLIEIKSKVVMYI